MSTKKLQIVTPIVTSVNGETGDVTIDTDKVFIVQGTLISKTDNSGGYDVNVTTSISDLKAAITAGKLIVGKFIKNNNDTRFYDFYSISNYYYFTTMLNGYISETKETIMYSPLTSQWSISTSLVMPACKSSDNGKFLQVVNGSPAWVALTNVAEEGA